MKHHIDTMPHGGPHIETSEPVITPQGDVGRITATRVHPDGTSVVRVNDGWWSACDVRPAN